jgi:hypothetical protein
MKRIETINIKEYDDHGVLISEVKKETVEESTYKTRYHMEQNPFINYPFVTYPTVSEPNKIQEQKIEVTW